ncbi:MAG TPA: helix-turn-helix domain-containing protein [Tepidisphaeraceae bacterium]|jgi:excisionase family DNA binding protein|nr:helix-turn-helix domain-containing protein [Tepidisphaeraceae bacterium]
MNNSPSVGTTLLTVPQVAARLGISTRKMWRLISQGLIPVVQVGARGTRILEAAVESFIAGLPGRSAETNQKA